MDSFKQRGELSSYFTKVLNETLVEIGKIIKNLDI